MDGGWRPIANAALRKRLLCADLGSLHVSAHFASFIEWVRGLFGPTRRPSQSELHAIQILRAVAALGVLTYHTMVEMATRFGGPVMFDHLVIGAAGVDLFFVISGFVMVYASEPLFGKRGASRVFFLRRLARIVPLYWALTAYLVIWFAIRNPDQALTQNPPGAVVASFLFYPYQSVVWSARRHRADSRTRLDVELRNVLL